MTYHTGNKRLLLADLVDLAFKDTLPDIAGESQYEKANAIPLVYCTRTLLNAKLQRTFLEDISLRSQDLVQIADELRKCSQRLMRGDWDNFLPHLLINYTRGFVFSATSDKDNPITIDDCQRGIEWILVRASGDADR